MKYLVSVTPDRARDGVEWAPAGEPVIPWYPAPPEHVFLAIGSFKRAPYAEVVDSPAIDPDRLLECLKRQYPGLPDKLHEYSILSTAKAAHLFPVGTRLQPFVEYEFPGKYCVKLKVLGKEEYTVVWDKRADE
jgi:hypothetical protein